MSEKNTNNENPNFRLKAVSEFLDGKHHFYIPSYQRGYRWDKKQVEDLLKDIWDFAKDDEKKKSDFYCLQPIVVKEKGDEWIVIDGQQRLTTLHLILEYIKEGSRTNFVIQSKPYEIVYETRKNLDFINPEKSTDIDSFHVFQAKNIIEQWFEENDVRFSNLEDVLFLNEKENEKIPQVKFIWYVVKTENDIKSIKIFNNLNKGKIKLTNAELIKALFVLKSENGEEELDLKELVYGWNDIENALHDDRFWYFLANKDYKPATRIDIIFDILTEKTPEEDDDYAYRKFQVLYDNGEDKLWDQYHLNNFTQAWNKIKEVFHTFQYWYDDSTIYHYIGYLIYHEVPIREIYNQCNERSKSQVVEQLRKLIATRVLKFNKEEVNQYTYSEKKEKPQLFKLLLFFNIQTCIKHQLNQNKVAENTEFMTYYKFPFDLFKLNNWDIEHVGSQKDNPLTSVKDKIIWLNYVKDISIDDPNWPILQEQAVELYKELKIKQKDENEAFKKLYNEIFNIIQIDEIKEGKDTIDNLTLLDAGTNRGYGNALFPTKRETIITKDMHGVFIPPCTKNLFLKYYSKKDTKNSQWKNTWTDYDRKAYLGEIHKTIDFIFEYNS